MTEESLPRWDLSSIFPNPASGEYLAALATLRTGIEQIQGLFDEFGIGLADGAHPQTDPELILSTSNEVGELAGLLDSYLYCWTTSDSNDTAAATAYGELDMINSALRALFPRLTQWLSTVKIDGESAGPILMDHRYNVTRAFVGAQHIMSAELEELAAALQATGGQAWVRARDETDSGMETTVTIDGDEQTVSVTELESWLSSPDRTRRQAGADAQNRSREAAAPAFAAALNAIKGEALTLAKKRKWESPLDWSLYISAIDRDILTAMFTAAESVHKDLHRYLRTKASLLGIEQMSHFDLTAPIDVDQPELTWEECASVTQEVLSAFSPRLASVVESALSLNWIDVEAREGKIGGGYCAGVEEHGSRILINFVPAFPTVQVLAHELGHAHHNACLVGRTSMQKETPMTLAETASMFCQRLVEEAVLARATPREKVGALDQILGESVALLLDLHARFHFEQEVFARRATRPLSVDEFTTIMEEKQRIAFGDGLATDGVHKWQWVQKPHYYDTDFHFYNYPYQFGYLFSLGLLKIYRDEPETFIDRYETLLSRTGMATAYDLAQEFGIDIRDTAFWQGSVEVIRSDIEAFTALTVGQGAR